MKSFSKILAGIVLALGIASLLVYLLGPHAGVSAAFDEYKSAYRSGDVTKATALTTQADISFWDEQRRHALRSPETAVKALDYKQRAAVLKLRSDVFDGKMTIEELENLDMYQLYAETREPDTFGKALANATVLFAVPTGGGTARGYLGFGAIQSVFLQAAFALSSGAYLNFILEADGKYKIDPTPVLDQGSKQMESLALQADPTGNKFIVQGLLRSDDPDREQKLWAPLIRE